VVYPELTNIARCGKRPDGQRSATNDTKDGTPVIDRGRAGSCFRFLDEPTSAWRSRANVEQAAVERHGALLLSAALGPASIAAEGCGAPPSPACSLSLSDCVKGPHWQSGPTWPRYGFAHFAFAAEHVCAPRLRLVGSPSSSLKSPHFRRRWTQAIGAAPAHHPCRAVRSGHMSPPMGPRGPPAPCSSWVGLGCVIGFGARRILVVRAARRPTGRHSPANAPKCAISRRPRTRRRISIDIFLHAERLSTMSSSAERFLRAFWRFLDLRPSPAMSKAHRRSGCPVCPDLVGIMMSRAFPGRLPPSSNVRPTPRGTCNIMRVEAIGCQRWSPAAPKSISFEAPGKDGFLFPFFVCAPSSLLVGPRNRVPPIDIEKDHIGPRPLAAFPPKKKCGLGCRAPASIPAAVEGAPVAFFLGSG